jgi:hypothetical protein
LTAWADGVLIFDSLVSKAFVAALLPDCEEDEVGLEDV